MLTSNAKPKTSIVRGVVTYYNKNETKKFGFIESYVDGKSVFFHLNRQRFPYCNGSDEIQFKYELPDGKKCEPCIGNRVVFVEELGPKGCRSSLWSFESDYDAALEAIRNRPTYRLRIRIGPVSQTKVVDGVVIPYKDKPVYRTLWEGNNLAALRMGYTKEMYPIKDEDHSARWIEEYDPNDKSWYLCNDPR